MAEELHDRALKKAEAICCRAGTTTSATVGYDRLGAAAYNGGVEAWKLAHLLAPIGALLLLAGLAWSRRSAPFRGETRPFTMRSALIIRLGPVAVVGATIFLSKNPNLTP
jgi:hypothetical protein